MTCSSDVDERTLREIYFPAFERSVKESQPYTVMCSYNMVNGTYSSENDWLLDHVLRKKWGFEGTVISDWGAVNERVKGLAVGMDIEMPASGGIPDAETVAAVQNGSLDDHYQTSVLSIEDCLLEIVNHDEYQLRGRKPARFKPRYSFFDVIVRAYQAI